LPLVTSVTFCVGNVQGNEEVGVGSEGDWLEEVVQNAESEISETAGAGHLSEVICRLVIYQASIFCIINRDHCQDVVVAPLGVCDGIGYHIREYKDTLRPGQDRLVRHHKWCYVGVCDPTLIGGHSDAAAGCGTAVVKLRDQSSIWGEYDADTVTVIGPRLEGGGKCGLESTVELFHQSCAGAGAGDACVNHTGWQVVGCPYTVIGKIQRGLIFWDIWF